MALDTTLRSASSGALGIGSASSSRLVPARNAELAAPAAPADNAKDTGSPAPLRSTGASAVGGALQNSVARAQQALDYLERVASQLENLKGELSAKLSSSRTQASQVSQVSQRAAQQLESSARQLSATLAARKSSAGGGVDANLNFTGQPAQQRFRIRGLDIETLQQNAPQTVAFSIGGLGGPQLAATVDPGQSGEDTARAIDRAVAPLGVRAGLDNGSLVFATSEQSWPLVRDSIAISGRGRVTAEEVTPALAPQQWPIGTAVAGNGGANTDALRQSLREVVQALERVRRSQDAASSALSNASAQVVTDTTPPPEVELATEDFASAAASTNYDSLLALSSALVGVSRERVLALLGLR